MPSEQPVVSHHGKTTILGPAGRSVANLHIVGGALGPGNDRTDSRTLVTHATCARSFFESSIFSCKALGPEIKTFVVCMMGHSVIRAIFDSLFCCGRKTEKCMLVCVKLTWIASVARALGHVVNAQVKGRPVFVREGIACRHTFVP